MVLKRILASSPRLDSCKMPFEGLPYSGIFEEFSVKFLVYYPLYPDFFVLLKRLWIIVPIRRYWTKAERSTMRTELHTRSMHSCPSGSGNFFVWLFSCLSSVELSIFKTNNLRIRKGLLPPRNSLCINKLRRSVTSLCQAAYEAFFVPVCRLCCFYVPTMPHTNQ